MSGAPPQSAAATARLPIPLPIKHVIRFVLHTCTGILLFGMVGGAAVVLNYLTQLMEGARLSPYILYAVHGLEFFLFAADFICLVAFIVKETLIFLRKTCLPRKGGLP
jgi:hypothetical protein